MSVTITGELRAMAREGGAPIVVSSITADGMVETQTCCVDKADFGRCCDAIDAVHANLERENESLRRELDRVLGEQEDRDGWVRLPKDADGEYIHLGDVMEWCNGSFTVHDLKLTEDGWQTWDSEHGYTVNADECIRHHAPTVEDVLREFVDEMNQNLGMYTGEAIDADEWRSADNKTIAEFAAKLRLAGDGKE